jgi:DNA-binding NarL/FixJ family response regulator
MPIRLIIADDHPFILVALNTLFQAEEDIQVLAHCRNGTEAMQAVRQHQPDILILDLQMPGKNGLAVLRELQQEKLPTRVVLLTAALDEDEVLEAIRLGVRGVMLKEMAPQLLLQCIRQVHTGGEWLERRSVSRALDKLLRREAATRQVTAVLSPRELEVVRLVSDGLRNKEIAVQLSVSEGTVKIHLHHIYEKLQVGSRLELLRYMQKQGLV